MVTFTPETGEMESDPLVVTMNFNTSQSLVLTFRENCKNLGGGDRLWAAL